MVTFTIALVVLILGYFIYGSYVDRYSAQSWVRSSVPLHFCGSSSVQYSPLMARSMTKEKHCRPIFYGAMVAEGIVALIWAAAATYFFQENDIIDQITGKAYSGEAVATSISKEWLGATRSHTSSAEYAHSWL